MTSIAGLVRVVVVSSAIGVGLGLALRKYTNHRIKVKNDEGLEKERVLMEIVASVMDPIGPDDDRRELFLNHDDTKRARYEFVMGVRSAENLKTRLTFIRDYQIQVKQNTKS